MSAEVRTLKMFKRYIEGNVLWAEFIEYLLSSERKEDEKEVGELIEFSFHMKHLYKKYQHGIR